METNYLKPSRETVEAIIKIVFSEEYSEYLDKIKELFDNKEYNKIIRISNKVHVIIKHKTVHHLVDLFLELNEEISYEKIIYYKLFYEDIMRYFTEDFIGNEVFKTIKEKIYSMTTEHIYKCSKEEEYDIGDNVYYYEHHPFDELFQEIKNDINLKIQLEKDAIDEHYSLIIDGKKYYCSSIYFLYNDNILELHYHICEYEKCEDLINLAKKIINDEGKFNNKELLDEIIKDSLIQYMDFGEYILEFESKKYPKTDLDYDYLKELKGLMKIHDFENFKIIVTEDVNKFKETCSSGNSYTYVRGLITKIEKGKIYLKYSKTSPRGRSLELLNKYDFKKLKIF